MASPDKRAPDLTTLLGIGSFLGICIGVGAFGGIFADKAAGTSPLLALLGVLLGIVVGALGAYQAIRPYVQSTRKSTTNDSV